MASVRKYRGKWQATIRRKGHKSISRTFSSKGAACTFARRVEFEMDVAQNPDDISTLSQITLAEMITRYRDTVTPSKKGIRQETSRMNYILKQPISQLTLDRLTTGVFARYRDDRLQQVGPQKVRHELNAFSVVLRTAKLDWDIPLRDIPIDHIRKPKIPPGRDRRLHDGEFEKLRETALNGLSPFIWHVIEFAIETAMRRGEIMSIEWSRIRWSDRIVHLPDTKNGYSRDVPLSTRAVDILLEQREQRLKKPFPYGVGAITHAWLKVVKTAKIDDLRFHDLRHEGISRLFEKGLSVPEVALVSGHRDFRMLARYTHMKAENIKLN